MCLVAVFSGDDIYRSLFLGLYLKGKCSILMRHSCQVKFRQNHLNARQKLVSFIPDHTREGLLHHLNISVTETKQFLDLPW